MDNPLGIYLHDHLAGANFAVDLLSAMKERNAEEHVQQFVTPLLTEIQEDRSTLREIAESVGSGRSTIKEVAAWLGEKASRVKLGSGSATAFAEFEALEFLALGVLGKMSLWRTLQVLCKFDTRLRAIDLQSFVSRANAQYEKIEARRIEICVSAFAPEIGNKTP
jgi:hypothetical protein